MISYKQSAPWANAMLHAGMLFKKYTPNHDIIVLLYCSTAVVEMDCRV